MIHTVLICWHNPDQTLLRWERDVLPGLQQYQHPFCITVMDNSPQHSQMLADYFKEDYVWNGGENTLYGGALNVAVLRRPSFAVLYVCSRHGRSLDHSWVTDIISPMYADSEVGQCGHLRGSNSPGGVAHDTGCEWVKDAYHFDDGVHQHVQGGVFAARTDLMRRFPYPPGLLHMYSDHRLTWAIEKAGYKASDVPSIISVWRDKAKPHERVGRKFVHEEE